LDDLHWADPASLDLLRALARQAPGLPLLLLATYRADELTRRHPLYQLLPTLVREARAMQLDLRALPGEAVRNLVRDRYALAGPAVIGQELPFDLWAVVSGADEEALLVAVERASEARLVEPTGAGLRFAHALTREALYEGTLPPRRRGWHRRVGEVLAAMP